MMFLDYLIIGVVLVVAAVVAAAAILANWDGLHTFWGDERED